jgi:hypothetical protein
MLSVRHNARAHVQPPIAWPFDSVGANVEVWVAEQLSVTRPSCTLHFVCIYNCFMFLPPEDSRKVRNGMSELVILVEYAYVI